MKGAVLEGRAVVLTPEDNVATALSDLDAGEQIALDDLPSAESITLFSSVPFGHKFALEPIPSGEWVYKYGEHIGTAAEPIDAGEWVHTHNCESNRGRGDLSEGFD